MAINLMPRIPRFVHNGAGTLSDTRLSTTHYYQGVGEEGPTAFLIVLTQHSSMAQTQTILVSNQQLINDCTAPFKPQKVCPPQTENQRWFMKFYHILMQNSVVSISYGGFLVPLPTTFFIHDPRAKFYI